MVSFCDYEIYLLFLLLVKFHGSGQWNTLNMPWLYSVEQGGLDVPFTQEPHNPSYFENGSEANLVWDYTDPHNNIQSIFYSVGGSG
nr:uncharacterized protein LOC131785391 [Pocillopora verrucosa]